MEDDIEAYVKTCHVCQVDKTERKKEAGLLQPVPIPERPWLSGKCPAAYMVARERLEVFSEEKDSLRIAQRRMRKYADQHRRSVEFSVSDKVLLKLSPQIMKQIVTKTRHWGLIPKYDGPFKVVKRMQMIRTGTDQRGILHQYLHSLMLRFRRSLITGLWAQKGKSVADAVWEKARGLRQFDDQIDDYLKIVSMRTSSSSGAGGLFNP
ncbi:hypothetical protein KY290_027625 [Solanum tuberosum]|uniref:Integrase zinc-binding domain-containing protein n=1 Tax=Solanum tuberosum TaxID=4113 RepID=A0ABQ7UGV1_SOLTU|nr:hypothetical protein KY290_027625 [Solanum tuberosum]